MLLGELAWGGTIKGTVRFTGSPSTKKVPVTVDQYVCGKEKDAEDLVVSPDKGIRNAVVWLTAAARREAGAAPFGPVFLDQKQCVFVPRVVVVPVGGTVEFLNSDRLLHNIHSQSKGQSPLQPDATEGTDHSDHLHASPRSSGSTATSIAGCARGSWSPSTPSTPSPAPAASSCSAIVPAGHVHPQRLAGDPGYGDEGRDGG